MIVFVVFVAIVLLGLVLQCLTKRWQAATGVPCILFITLLMTDNLFPEHGTLAFTLGIPMVFFAGLLGSYIYETRINPERHTTFEQDSTDERVNSESNSDKNK